LLVYSNVQWFGHLVILMGTAVINATFILIYKFVVLIC